MKVVIFGTGKYYQKHISEIRKNAEITALLDNNSRLWGTYFEGIQVYNPKDIIFIEYDKIILLSAKAYEMKSQLRMLGVLEEKICYGAEFNRHFGGVNPIVYGKIIEEYVGAKVAIVTTDMDYNGGTMAAIYAAQALKLKGYAVCLIAPFGNQTLIDFLVKMEITVYIYSSLPYVKVDEMACIDLCEVVIVNVFQMIRCACEISKKKPVIWWIHESSEKYSDIYTNVLGNFSDYAFKDNFSNLKIIGVSNIAKNNFNHFFPNCINDVMPYGIPDEKCEVKKVLSSKIIFAIIGGLCMCKAQDIFIQAVASLSEEERESAEFWIIGKNFDKKILNYVKDFAYNYSQIKILGEKNRTEMKELFKQIDVVVCSSREDCLPIVMTEGMMHGKLCITTDKTGTVDYIIHGQNGLICKANNVLDLADKMSWAISNKKKLKKIGKCARALYEKIFTIEKFAERLNYYIEKTKYDYTHRIIEEN